MGTLFKDKIVVNGVTFNDTTLYPAGALDWGMDELIGWDATADLELPETQQGSDVDGAILGEVATLRPRFLLAGGYVRAADRATAESLWDVLIRDAFPRSTELTLTRHEPIAKFVTCRVNGKREVQRVGPLMFRWIVPLECGDPLKYDASPIPEQSQGTAGVAGQSTTGFTFPLTFPLTFSQTTSGSTVQSAVTVTNRGTADTSPLITITGPLIRGAWRVSNDTTGEYLRFDVGLSTGDTLVIDFKNQIAELNGSLVTSTISGDFWKVRPGANTIRLYGDYDAAASLTVSILSAWEL